MARATHFTQVVRLHPARAARSLASVGPEADWTLGEAARLLGVSRVTLHRLMREHAPLRAAWERARDAAVLADWE